MKGYIIEYSTNGWSDIEIQLDVDQPHFDRNKEVLSIWSFENSTEKDKIIEELRDFRLMQRRTQNERSTNPNV